MIELITGIGLAGRIFGPMITEFLTGLGDEDKGKVDAFMGQISNVFDRLDPAIRASIAYELELEMKEIADDPVRAEYMDTVHKRIQELRAKQAEEGE